MKYYLKICVVLTLVCTLMTGVLALIHEVTEPVIRENELTLQKNTLQDLFPNMSDEWKEKKIENSTVTLVRTLYDDQDNLLGYCADVSEKGYAGDVTMMVGVDAHGAVVGVRVVSHSETKGLSESKLADALCREFDGVKGQQKLTSKGGQIDMISGATYSSKAVLNGVNNVLTVIEDMMKGDK